MFVVEQAKLLCQNGLRQLDPEKRNESKERATLLLGVSFCASNTARPAVLENFQLNG